MKIRLFSIFCLALLTLTACKQEATTVETETEEEATAPDYAAFESKVKVIRSFIQSHCDEDIEAIRNIISDTLQWSPPTFAGTPWLGKEDLMGALQNYHDSYENITYQEGIVLQDTVANGFWSGSVYPEGLANTAPGVVRTYGTWSGTHTASQKPFAVKWFALISVNDDNKIVSLNDYFDVNGLAVQAAAEEE